MTSEEAQDIIDAIGGAVRSTNFSVHTYELWMAKLERLDIDLALRAMKKGTDQWDYFPSWSAFHELYLAEIRAQARERGIAENAQMLSRGKTPEWVFVWLWARYLREPPLMRSLPQQEEWVDPTDMMSAEDYAELRDEWVNAGEPKLQLASMLAST